MSDEQTTQPDWEAANGAYLAASIRWLRLRLELQALDRPVPQPTATHASPAPAAPTSTTPAERRRLWRRRETPPAPAPITEEPRLALPPVTRSGLEAQIEQAAAERQNTVKSAGSPPGLLMLAQRLGLSDFERDVLLLCSAPELDPGIGELCARAGGGLPHPSFALAFAALQDGSWDAVSPERPLRYWRLIEIEDRAGGPLTAAALRADERIVNYIKGLNHLDERLTPLLAPLEEAGGGATESQHEISARLSSYLESSPRSRRAPVVNLIGSDRSSKQIIARETAQRFGLELVRIPAALLPSDPDALDLLSRLWDRECALMPLALYLDALELDQASRQEREAPSLARFLARSPSLVFLDSRDHWEGLGASTAVAEVGKPTPAEQRAAWERLLGERGQAIAAELSSQFNLNLATIEAIAANGLVDGEPSRERLWSGCLGATRPGLDRLAARIEPYAGWDDLVLGPQELSLLHEVVGQVRRRPQVYDDWGFRGRMNRGLGISALFAGDSGVGKTMAAEVIAGELGLGLYRIDLSAVVSKYIGETEKNLRSVFDAAEGGGAILLFDEADALFGKRSEVKDSHDRYANIEVNYLLQRMEAYRGLAILATNAKNMLDTAFLRRLRFVIDFPFPGTAARRAIWERAFPQSTPLDPALDYDRLARLVLSGGSIHNVALNATFLAAQNGSAVTMPLLLQAARTEFKKLERPINEADFVWHEPAAPVEALG